MTILAGLRQKNADLWIVELHHREDHLIPFAFLNNDLNRDKLFIRQYIKFMDQHLNSMGNFSIQAIQLRQRITTIRMQHSAKSISFARQQYNRINQITR